MKREVWFLLLTGLVFGPLHAGITAFDFYGIDLTTQNQIMACCKDQLREHMILQQQLNVTNRPLAQQSHVEKILERQKVVDEWILKKINTLGRFRIIEFSTIYYPQEQATYMTVDIVKASEAHRLPISPEKNMKRPIKKSKDINQVLKAWNKYFDKHMQLMIAGKIDSQSKSCPVVHCLWGFDKKELVEDLPIFKKGAEKYKDQLMEMVLYSDNKMDREQAIFILAHMNNEEELAHFLVKFIADPNASVRNNSMRVLGAILSRRSIHGIDLDQILSALDYPYVTDRNKAAYVVLNMVRRDKSIHPLVIKKSGRTLIHLLQLKQPNNHDFAYSILKVISNKNYSERDYTSWQKWVNSQK